MLALAGSATGEIVSLKLLQEFFLPFLIRFRLDLRRLVICLALESTSSGVVMCRFLGFGVADGVGPFGESACNLWNRVVI